MELIWGLVHCFVYIAANYAQEKLHASRPWFSPSSVSLEACLAYSKYSLSAYVLDRQVDGRVDWWLAEKQT